MADEKVYCGNAKIIKTQYGEMTKISMTEDDVKALQGNLDNGWVNLVIKERREPSAGGMTHYLEVDKWKPEPREGGESKSAPAKPAKANVEDEITPEDLPF